MGSSLSDIMKQKLTEYAIRQGKILVDSATGLQVCSADQSDCVLLEEWAKSVSAAYYIFSLVVQQNEKYMKYALQQTDPCSCWAATITTVVAIHRKASFYSEDLIFRCVADKTIPQLSSLRTLIPTVAREPDLTMEEKANLTAQPADNSLEARLEYCFTLTDKVLDKLFFQAYPNQEDYKNAVLNTMMTIKLAYPTELAEQNLYKGLDRMREREERFFRMHHFEYLRINFQDFTAARLKTLLEEKGPLIMALNYLCLVNNGRSLTDKITYLEGNVTNEYESHYIVVTQYIDALDEVCVINTLPYKLDSSAPNGFRACFRSSGESADPELFRASFTDFSRMVQSDVRCLSRVPPRNGNVALTSAEAQTIPVMYMEANAYSAADLQEIMRY